MRRSVAVNVCINCSFFTLIAVSSMHGAAIERCQLYDVALIDHCPAKSTNEICVHARPTEHTVSSKLLLLSLSAAGTCICFRAYIRVTLKTSRTSLQVTPSAERERERETERDVDTKDEWNGVLSSASKRQPVAWQIVKPSLQPSGKVRSHCGNLSETRWYRDPIADCHCMVSLCAHCLAC